MSNNTIKDLPCNYASIPIEKKEGSPDRSKFATRTFFDEGKIELFLYVKNIIKKYQNKAEKQLVSHLES